MRFTETTLKGAFIIEIDPAEDERGFFARTFCERDFQDHGLVAKFAQCSISHNRHKGTLRGMHYQTAPHEEAKLVRCTQGVIYDVIVDLRRASPTFCKWIAVELSAINRRSIYISEGFAHGFLALQDECEVFYQISKPYVPEAARGVRWNDPAFGIVWPQTQRRVMSERDRSYPDFRP